MNKFLNKIKQKNIYGHKTQLPKIDNSAYAIPSNISQDKLFKQELEKVGGHCYLCKDINHLLKELKELFEQKQWKKPFAFETWTKDIMKRIDKEVFSDFSHLEKMDVGIGICDYLVSWTGSVLVSSFLPGARQFYIFSPDLIILAKKEQLVLTPDEALDKVYAKYNRAPSQITLITGPSKTADIEKTLIYGMHGPRSLYVFII